jgi:uncharacterized protein (TIGR00661 family)
VAQGKPVLFYGVNSEGLGHATRAIPVIQALSQRYQVHVFCGGRVLHLMRRTFPYVHRIWWVRLIYRDNTCAVWTTTIRSFLQGPYVLFMGALVLLRAILLRPVAVLTDFESQTSWGGMLALRKVITVDNQQLMRRAQLPEPSPEARQPRKLALRVLFWNNPVIHRVLISSFFRPPLKSGEDPTRVRYVPAAVRQAVLDRRDRTRQDGPVLVYQTSTSNRDLPATLRAAAERLGLSFVVYGTAHTGTEADGRVTYRPFSEAAFLDDLAAAPFVISNGGHSTIVEALTLGKPVLAEPVRLQYEQEVNAHGLETLGVGRRTGKLTVGDVARFQADVPAMRTRLAAVTVADNDALVAAIEETLAEVNPVQALPPRVPAPSPPAP